MLLYKYRELNQSDLLKSLATAISWLDTNEDNDIISLTLGRFAKDDNL